MLVLSRRKNESIMIGDNIEVTVVSVDGDVVRIGIKAPRDIDVHRKEIYTAIQEENKEASHIKHDLSAMVRLLGKTDK
jgi:carbon storage regulator